MNNPSIHSHIGSINIFASRNEYLAISRLEQHFALAILALSQLLSEGKKPVVFVRFPIIIIIISAVQIKVDWVDYGFPSVSSDHIGPPEHIWKCIKFGKQVRTANSSMKCEDENASCHWWPMEGLVLHKPIGSFVLCEPVQPSCRIEVWCMCGPINAARSFITPRGSALFCSLHNVSDVLLHNS